jgi:hypothetical protein
MAETPKEKAARLAERKRVDDTMAGYSQRSMDAKAAAVPPPTQLQLDSAEAAKRRKDITEKYAPTGMQTLTKVLGQQKGRK